MALSKVKGEHIMRRPLLNVKHH